MSAGTILVIAVALIFGVLGARLFKLVKIPQVVGYIVIGLILGVSVTNILTKNLIVEFRPINYIALGIIGFLVGGELKKSVFKKFGKSMIIILLFEGISAFILVGLFTGFFTKNWSLAIILGALASATAPAATVDVLWEYKSAGVLTTMIFAIVALDDGLALLLYGFANSIARILVAHRVFSVYEALLKPLYSIGGAALLGALIAVIFRALLDLTKKYKHEQDLMLPILHKTFPNKNLRETYQILLSSNTTFLPVVDENNPREMLGIISLKQIKDIIREETISLSEQS